MNDLIGFQQDAIRIYDRALLVEAGAGTGKTWTLVQRFLFLLEQYPEWALESIAAVTFTEKAAREMRTRLRVEIERKAREESPASLWQTHRRALERLQVGTIHSLCARILHENAIAAGIDPRFTVLDEQQAQLIQEEAIRQSLADLVEADDPALELLTALRVRDLSELLSGLLSQRGTVQRLFDRLPGSGDLLTRWRAGMAEMRRAVWQDLLTHNPDLTSAGQYVLAVEILDENDKLAPSIAAAKAGCGFFDDQDRILAAQTWLQIRLVGGKAGAWGGADALVTLKDALKALRSAADALNKAGCLVDIGPFDEQAAQALQLWRSLWERTAAVYDRMKAERQALDFDDLELRTERLLNQQPRDPRLESYLRGLNHLMVDEFQDTNEAQQHIIYALAPPSDGGRLFVVGDAKQSIYRFRQAQVTVFNRTAQDIQRITGYPALQLDRSFRSHQSLVSALNNLFARLMRPLSEEYADYEARPGPLQAERQSPPSHPAAPSPVELWLLPDMDQAGEKINAEETRIFEAQLLARRLRELHEAKFPVWDKQSQEYRPFRFSDAAVLFRATTSLPLYEEQFKAAGLPYLTVSGRGYFDRPEVRDLLALLAALYNPCDDLNLAIALRSPLFGLNDETLYRLRCHTRDGRPAANGIPYATALSDPPRTDQPGQVAFAHQVLAELSSLAGRTDPWRLLRRILDLTGYEAALAMSDATGGNGRQRSNVHKLLAMAQQQYGLSLSVFLRSLQELTAREAREGEALGAAPESGAVTLMSIHAAKGLEFPVGVVADLGRRPNRPGAAPVILHDPAIGLVCKQRDENGDWQTPAGYAWGQWLLGRMESAENKRLLYVACTRAADLLILSGKTGDRGGWLDEILAAWQVGLIGPEEEDLAYDGFTLHLMRPAYQPIQAVDENLQVASSPGLAEMPILAQPLPPFISERHIAVTHLQRALAEDSGEMAALRPAVRSTQVENGQARAPAYLLGRLVHRLMANWENLALSRIELESRLIALARAEGISHPEAIHHAVGRVLKMIDQFKQTGLYEEIDSAVQRSSEVPFTLSTPNGQLHGVIDLLFQDRKGQWHLVDWKTDWFPEGELEAQALAHRPQVAIYAAAVRKLLQVEPLARVCFMAVGGRVREYSAAELEGEDYWAFKPG